MIPLICRLLRPVHIRSIASLFTAMLAAGSIAPAQSTDPATGKIALARQLDDMIDRAYPQTAKDPVVLAAQIILALQTIVSREIAPIEPAVVTVGSIHGGTKHNIIPNEVKLELTLRSYTDEVRKQTIAAIRRIVAGLAQAAGLPENRFPEVRIRDEYTPATYNDPALGERVAAAFRKVIGSENVIQVDAVMGGEDFGRYGRTAEEIPIFIYWLGTVAPAQYESETSLPSLHSSLFAPDPEPAIQTGVKTMTAAVLELAGK